MQALHNHSGELIAYHYQNMLIHPEDLQVMGLVLEKLCVRSTGETDRKIVSEKSI